MLKNKFFLVLAVLLTFGYSPRVLAQSNCLAIALNEISVSNNSYADNNGKFYDAVEIYNAFTSSVSLQSYYLSNDRNNLFKWKFPTTFTLGIGQYGMVYLSGLNQSTLVAGQWYHHANFSMDQCKGQYLILSTNQGVVRDSVFVQKTAIGHTWGRIDYCQNGINAWRLYPANSFPLVNPAAGYFKGYMPTPTFSPQPGWNKIGDELSMRVNGVDADSTNSCNEVHYTIDGTYPTQADPVYTGTTTPILIANTTMFRAVNFQKQLVAGTYTPNPACLTDVYLPSFCETNTYFSTVYDDFHTDFGVMSVAIHSVDTNWFNSGGASTPTVHVEYFDKKQQVLEGYAVMRRPPQETWLTAQKGFYLTIDDRRGYGCNFEGNIFNVAGLGASSRTVFPTLHVKAGDIESHSGKPVGTTSVTPSQGTGIRDVFIQSLAIKYDLKVNPLHIKPTILFVNGKYWGVYDFREVYDKYYESYYNPVAGASKDSLYAQYYHGGDNWIVNYEVDGSTSNYSPLDDFRKNVVDGPGGVLTAPMNNVNNYNKLLKHLDKESFMDYIILNSHTQNSNLWNYNIGFARSGGNKGKWHYYAWNMPATYTFQAVQTNSYAYNSPTLSPCNVQSALSGTNISTYAGNAHGTVFNLLMGSYPGKTSWGNPSFKLEYKNRYQDLLNTALKCENLLAHYDYVVSLYKKEMAFHETAGNGLFPSVAVGDWDTNAVRLRYAIAGRCEYMKNAFGSANCYGMLGPYDIKVDVFPAGAGSVRLNSVVLPFYIWTGRYFNSTLSFKAIPTSTNYVFHHWEFKTHPIKNNVPLSVDSVSIDYNATEEVLAVFTDITTDIDIPTGFSPNGDGNNDVFKPLGSAAYATEFEFRIWNRWGQEVFRSTEASYGWDGYYEGKEAQTGVYAYVITYKNVYNEAKIKKGNVTLVR